MTNHRDQLPEYLKANLLCLDQPPKGIRIDIKTDPNDRQAKGRSILNHYTDTN